MKNRVTVTIAGQEYTLVAAEDVRYVQRVASHVDAKVQEVLDGAKEPPLSAGAMWLREEDGGRLCYVFGRVDDPAVTSLAVSFRREDGGEMAFRAIRRDAFLEQDGRMYFLLRMEGVPWAKGSYEIVTALDDDGTAVEELTI